MLDHVWRTRLVCPAVVPDVPAAAIAHPRTTAYLRAFTLIELLITIAIVGVLIALLVPALRGTLGASRAFRCQISQRSTAFDFQVFADASLHGNRGDDDQRPGGRDRFRLETFQESQYGVDEFWAYGSDSVHRLPDRSGRDPMRCAEVRGQVELRRGLPCSEGAVGPPENVSFGFNVRFALSDELAARGSLPYVVLTSRILEGGPGAAPSTLPLLWDIHGAGASAAGVSPLFSGPSLGSTLLFPDGRYWWPALRHNGAINVGFVDGHVASTRAPLNEHDWQWGYEPSP